MRKGPRSCGLNYLITLKEEEGKSTPLSGAVILCHFFARF